MLLTDIFLCAILLAKSERTRQTVSSDSMKGKENTNFFWRRFIMFDIYEKIAELDDCDNAIGVSPLAYVSLSCAR